MLALKYLSLFITGCFYSSLLMAQITQLQLDSTLLDVRVVAEEVKLPYDMVWGPDGWIWFTEREGYIKRLNPENGEIKTVHFVEEVYVSEDNSGMYALALHPDFPFVPYFYVNYTTSLHKAKLTRFTYDLQLEVAIESEEIISEIDGNESHNGSRLIFTPDKKLLFATGDAYRAAWAQDIDRLQGKILRMNPDGSVPDDNPFPGSLTYSYGHRNPQGLVLTPQGNLFSSEHGTGNDDELNLIIPGRNYGWPEVEGFCNWSSEQEPCQRLNVVVPLKIWTPTSAPCGMDYYDHEAIPEWRNSLIQALLKAGPGELRGQRMEVLNLNETQDSIIQVREYFAQTFGRLRDVLVSPDGRVFICTSNREDNGAMVVQHNDDKIIELRNPDFPVLTPDPPEIPPQSLHIFPNPSREVIKLRFPFPEGEVQLSLQNLAGQQLRVETFYLDNYIYFFERKDLIPGLYLLQLRLPDGTESVHKIQIY